MVYQPSVQLGVSVCVSVWFLPLYCCYMSRESPVNMKTTTCETVECVVVELPVVCQAQMCVTLLQWTHKQKYDLMSL